MRPNGLHRPVLLGLWALPFIVITAIAVILVWGHGADTQVVAHEPHPDLDFSLRIDDCIGGAVDTKGGDAKCDIGIGSTFTAAVDLNPLPGDIASYYAFDASLTYTGVTSKDSVSFTWPDCVFGAPSYGVDSVMFGCLIGIGAPFSTYTGPLGVNDFNCTQQGPGAITLVHGVSTGDTNLTDSQGGQHAEGVGTTETLTINCVSPPPPTSTPCPDNDGDTLCDSDDPDDDNDGCTDVRELAPKSQAAQGGGRDPLNFWDYADMPDPNDTPQRDGMVRVPDIVRVLNRYGADDQDGTAPINRNTDPLSTPPKTGYHPAYDRTYVGPNPWNLGPPNGTIRVPDVVAVLNQYGHDCT